MKKNKYSDQCEAAVNKAIELAGSQRKLAKMCGEPIIQSHISYWKNIGKKINSAYVLKLEKAFKGKMTRHDMRPDLYPGE
jgi:DNA-binding transcriptional regulator YdaS (Cro superfamily)